MVCDVQTQPVQLAYGSSPLQTLDGAQLVHVFSNLKQNEINQITSIKQRESSAFNLSMQARKPLYSLALPTDLSSST